MDAYEIVVHQVRSASRAGSGRGRLSAWLSFRHRFDIAFYAVEVNLTASSPRCKAVKAPTLISHHLTLLKGWLVLRNHRFHWNPRGPLTAVAGFISATHRTVISAPIS
jgi:hypothetical protein